ncbi:MAG: cytochrome-c peroxidase [Bacteroidota bacterium]|jgi:cytochrome c peroxidase
MKKTIAILAGTLLVLISCSESKEVKTYYTVEELGEALFFDPILSRDSTISCASCHQPQFAFADNKAVSDGFNNQKTDRNTPSCMNMSARNAYFWDGRAETLEEQALGPIESSVEMNLPLSIAIKRLKRSEQYKQSFRAVFNAMPSIQNMATALADYQRTLETNDSPFDNYLTGRDTTQLSASAKRGLELFNTKARCFDCHFGVDFTGNDKFKNIGLYNGKNYNDAGRYKISNNPKDIGAFKTPGLRNIAQTAPYMHDGSIKTLADVIDYYNEPDKLVPNSINRDTSLSKPLGLTAAEKKDLENFLLSLSDKRFAKK